MSVISRCSHDGTHGNCTSWLSTALIPRSLARAAQQARLPGPDGPARAMLGAPDCHFVLELGSTTDQLATTSLLQAILKLLKASVVSTLQRSSPPLSGPCAAGNDKPPDRVCVLKPCSAHDRLAPLPLLRAAWAALLPRLLPVLLLMMLQDSAIFALQRLADLGANHGGCLLLMFFPFLICGMDAMLCEPAFPWLLPFVPRSQAALCCGTQ